MDGDGEFAPVGPAPAGAWTVRGGNPARTRGTLTVAPRRAPDLAWTYESKGRLIGEPVVWGDFIVLDERLSRDERNLLLLDRVTGERVGRAVHRTGVELAPTIWDDRLVVRADNQLLHGYSVGRRGLRRVWRHSSEGELGEPVLVGQDVVFVDGGTLVCHPFGKRKPRWTFGSDFLGPLSVHGGEVLGLQRRRDGEWYSLSVNLASGSGNIPEALPTPSGMDEAAKRATIMAVDGGLYVQLNERMRLGDVRSHAFIVLDKDRVSRTMSPPFLAPDHPLPPARSKAGLIACTRISGWVRMQGQGGILLAAGEHHDELLTRDSPPALTPGVCFLSGLAVDIESLDVLWGLPERGPLIPVTGGVLAVREDRSSLAAYLRVRERDEVPVDLAGVGKGWSSDEGLAVLVDGEIVDGRLSVEAVEGGDGELVVGASRRAARHALADVALLADGERLLWASGARDFEAACGDLAELHQRELLEKNSRAYVSSKDPALIAEVSALALRVGASDSLIDRLDKGYERHIDSEKPSKSASAKVREILDEARALPAATRWEWSGPLVEAVASTDRVEVGRQVLIAFLETYPEHREAREALGLFLPPQAPKLDLQREDVETLIDWLEFARATERVAITEVERPDGKTLADTTADERSLGDASSGWRNDLVGHRSESLLLIAGLDTPGAMARILSLGELMVDTLDEWFARREVVRDTSTVPLEIHLFASRATYLRVNSDLRGHVGLTWTAGFFDPTANRSRLYMPSGDDGFEDAKKTFLHELTHHWLSKRCPAFKGDDVRRSQAGNQPGYWVVEGFACLAGELQMDVAGWSVEVDRQLDRRSAVVASADPKILIPWEALYSMPHRGLSGLASMAPSEVPAPMTLGRYFESDGVGLFYSQAAATARYLFEAEDGRFREALMQYVTDYYSANAEALDVQQAFGLSPKELGERVRAWCESRLADQLGQS